MSELNRLTFFAEEEPLALQVQGWLQSIRPGAEVSAQEEGVDVVYFRTSRRLIVAASLSAFTVAEMTAFSEQIREDFRSPYDRPALMLVIDDLTSIAPLTEMLVLSDVGWTAVTQELKHPELGDQIISAGLRRLLCKPRQPSTETPSPELLARARQMADRDVD